MNEQLLRALQIDPGQRRRRQRSTTMIFLVVGGLAALASWFAWARSHNERRVFKGNQRVDAAETAAATTPATVKKEGAAAAPAAPAKSGDAVLTTSGYIVNRERIELSPRMMGLVTWLGVKKGDLVKKDQVLVRLDDAEQRARLLEIEGTLLGAKVALERAKIAFQRVKKLRATNNETAEREDEARLSVMAAEATIQQIEGQREMVKVQLDWTIIRSPIDGVVLEKLAVAGALVTPQSFGGTRGPSTALVALADPQDLQVEVDVNESDLPKVRLEQRCRVTPEAFPDHRYGAVVAEIAPEASRQKGTLQIKVQIEQPDRFLTPELSAKVEFLK
ncbi:MAG TPA: efflux RND transporter periplasmic adaptor subunit [Chthoniobacteraceae bacterium]|nr:efflux RND transporter periplasmic adaptor subunit [Chthoniobacteraceae bacterium]